MVAAIIQKVLINLALGFMRIISLLPMAMTRYMGSLLGVIGFYVAGKRRNVAIKNLSLCFPQMAEAEKVQIIKQHFKYLLTSALEYGLVFYASATRIRQLVHFKNIHHLYEYYDKHPIILLCPHFVGLDLAAIRISLEQITGCSMYSEQSNSYISNKLKNARLRFAKDQNCIIFSRDEGLRPIIKRLRQKKEVFYYLPDQDVGERESLFVPFFAHDTCATISALPKLVSLTNAVVVPMVVYRVKDTYMVEFFAAWSNYPSGDLRADVIKMNQYIESVVMDNLPQYFWVHKRFKTQPNMKRGDIYSSSLNL